MVPGCVVGFYDDMYDWPEMRTAERKLVEFGFIVACEQITINTSNGPAWTGDWRVFLLTENFCDETLVHEGDYEVLAWP